MKNFESAHQKEFSFSAVCKKSTERLYERKCTNNTEKNYIRNLSLNLNEFTFQGWL